MAHMTNHAVTEVWRDRKNPDLTFHVTKNDRLLAVTKKRLAAAAKLLFFSDKLHGQVLNSGATHSGFNFSGVGRRATATEYRERLARRAERVQ